MACPLDRLASCDKFVVVGRDSSAAEAFRSSSRTKTMIMSLSVRKLTWEPIMWLDLIQLWPPQSAPQLSWSICIVICPPDKARQDKKSKWEAVEDAEEELLIRMLQCGGWVSYCGSSFVSVYTTLWGVDWLVAVSLFARRTPAKNEFLNFVRGNRQTDTELVLEMFLLLLLRLLWFPAEDVSTLRYNNFRPFLLCVSSSQEEQKKNLLQDFAAKVKFLTFVLSRPSHLPPPSPCLA